MPIVFAVAAALAIAVYQVLPDDPWLIGGWQMAVGYAGAVAVLVGARRLPRKDRLPWWLFAVGLAANVTGIGVAILCSEVWHLVDLPTPADPLFLLLYPFCAAGIAVLIRRRESGRDWTAMIDATTITTGFGLLAWIYVIAPSADGGKITMLGEATQSAYPIGDLVMIAMMTRLLRGSGPRGGPFWLLTGSLGAFLAGDTAWVVMGNLIDQGYPVEDIVWLNRGISSIFLVAFALFGAAALHRDARTLGAPAGPAVARLGRVHLALLTLASLVAPALLAVQLAHGQVTDGMAIVVASAALFLLVVTRMAQLVRQVERQAQQVRELARRDELTGLPNRRAWNDELPRALEDARRDGRPVSVALLDLDLFKQFNDTYGHPAGDRLLKSSAAAWQEQLRTVDTLARYGGEEFVVLLPGAEQDEAREVLQRALAATPLGQTFSAGVAVWDGRETSDKLIERADRALYDAKAAGRDQIIAAANRPATAAARK
ncbi:GGDEF domain-containing protein [Actinoplanes sp. Pm04-4]|uniref:GGDEF domain-containing protein n=1 Tax=Paractinoplanes pyxinae TaxID=2997416 RepID=A0ABT4AZ11_9ACTN|nr:GGDEF domain-containing protein [Actinoplanes pyxinae]MCY1139487.1 GGDEF domain-containing protein [Actinoplanes pyxinae]